MKIVLIEPEIPQNTGSIARSCAAMKTPLHLVGKLGFDLSEKAVRRAGLDYWPYVDLHQHQSWEEYLEKNKTASHWFFTTKATLLYTDVEYSNDAALVFGSETRGLGDEFLSKVPDEQKVKIPMLERNVRSLNLSNAASVALYEVARQVG